jgi:hypothetical protein
VKENGKLLAFFFGINSIITDMRYVDNVTPSFQSSSLSQPASSSVDGSHCHLAGMQHMILFKWRRRNRDAAIARRDTAS